jgi:2-(1,2-epoxy-1,2-dihydrophenyl)acetyl-CoA isomerase
MSYEQLLTGVEDSVCVLTMNRPERLNAWTPQMGAEMAQAIKDANEDEDIVGIVLTGAGRGFCAGADIEAVFKARADGNDAGSNSRMGDWVSLVRESKPIVAAVNGPAVGVGLTQVLPMDYIVASAGAKLSMRFVKMGLVPELASSHFLGTRMGFGNASELMLSGRTIVADEARELGLVDKVVEPEKLLETAVSLAKGMGDNPLASVRLIKELITANSSEGDLKAVQQREMQALQQCYVSAEHKEAISAFLEKREPDFKTARKG